MPTFKNDLILRETPADGPGYYRFRKPPTLLFSWSRLFQCVVSQAGTYLLTGSFHKGQCAIYKSEGGCRIDGVGELVLYNSSCRFDYGPRKDSELTPLATLISDICEKWDPNDPIHSMLNEAAASVLRQFPTLRGNKNKPLPSHEEFLKSLLDAIKNGREGGPFGGNSLSSFFNWNPFSDPPHDREYLRFCYTKHSIPLKTEAEVDQMFSDEDLGKRLLADLKRIAKERHTSGYQIYPLCCSPSRHGDELGFRVNTGQSTNIDGWKSQEELEAFINSDQPIKVKE